MRVAPSEVLQLAVRAESARQPDLARELYILAGRMDRGPGTDGLEPTGSPALDYVFVLWNESHSPACKSCVENTHARSAAWARGFRLAQRIGLDPESIAVAEAAGRVS
jgi:acetaldehyde dehydrogenase (acetylating)